MNTNSGWTLGVSILGMLLLAQVGSSATAEPPTVPDPIAETLTLDELVQAASQRFPLRREQQARREITEHRLDTLETRFKPQLDVVGHAAYHSEVPSLPAGLGVSPPKEQYSLALDTDLRLWDGGRTETEKTLEEAARDIDLASVDVSFFDWRSRIEDAYFLALSAQAETDLLRTLETDLEAQLAVLDARVDAGVALSGDRAVLAAELAGQRQRIALSTADRGAALDLLAALSGRDIADSVLLRLPETTLSDPSSGDDLLAAATAAATGEGVGRPEMDQARATQRLLQEQVKMASLAGKPLVSAFAQGGVGRPADQNFFETDPTPFVVLGVRVRWRPFDWGTAGREQEIRRLERQISAARLSTFLESLSAGLRQMARRIEASRSVLASDDQIVELREAGSRQAAAQLRGGVITPSAYLIERNAEHRARLTREQHRLRLARQTVDFYTTLGTSK